MVGNYTEVKFVSISIVVFGNGLTRENLYIYQNHLALKGRPSIKPKKGTGPVLVLGVNDGGFGGNLQD